MVISEPRKNLSYTYITDTAVCDNIIKLAKDTDVLHHECTFMDDEEELAEKSGHCTIGQVLDIAEKSNVKQLHLAHFSSRYDAYRANDIKQKTSFKIIATRDKSNITYEN